MLRTDGTYPSASLLPSQAPSPGSLATTSARKAGRGRRPESLRTLCLKTSCTVFLRRRVSRAARGPRVRRRVVVRDKQRVDARRVGPGLRFNHNITRSRLRVLTRRSGTRPARTSLDFVTSVFSTSSGHDHVHARYKTTGVYVCTHGTS